MLQRAPFFVESQKVYKTHLCAIYSKMWHAVYVFTIDPNPDDVAG